jgi:hypothetical protein
MLLLLLLLLLLLFCCVCVWWPCLWWRRLPRGTRGPPRASGGLRRRLRRCVPSFLSVCFTATITGVQPSDFAIRREFPNCTFHFAFAKKTYERQSESG